jgi:hypothetical protein
MYGYGTLKPVKVISRSGKEKRENSGENQTREHYMHIWKCCNKAPVQILYANKNI